jgi:hypothetical protein
MELFMSAKTHGIGIATIPASKWTSKVIQITCAQRSFHMIRSGDYTMEELHQEVARLMSCHPKELFVVASDVDMNVPSKAPGTLLADVSRIEFRTAQGDYSSDVEMDDM